MMHFWPVAFRLVEPPLFLHGEFQEKRAFSILHGKFQEKRALSINCLFFFSKGAEFMSMFRIRPQPYSMATAFLVARLGIRTYYYD